VTVRISQLANGIHVITHHMPMLETTALGVWVRAGARDETAAQNGISHLLEHMAFKGTSRRSARQIAEEIEAAGGDINAATSMETTSYYARVLKEDWPLALDILGDILTDPIFDGNELALEQDVIAQEIAAANDTPDDLVFELAQEAVFDGHPLGRSILGTESLVRSHTCEDIRRYRQTQYTGERIVVSAAGHVDHDALVAHTEQKFDRVPTGPGVHWMAPSFQSGIRLAEKPIDQTHLVLTFPSVGYRDDDIYAVQLLANILGGGMSSRLFQEVREQRGLCYSVFAFASAYADAGVMAVYAATAPGKVNELSAVVGDVISSLGDGVLEDELHRAKAQLKAALVMNLESASGRADQIARQFHAHGKVPEVSSIIERVEQVDGDSLKRLAQSLFHTKRPALAAAGDISGLASYDQIAARFA
jgi:predicted Zn-dependent peptidase